MTYITICNILLVINKQEVKPVKHPTCQEIAKSQSLWEEYVDPSGEGNRNPEQHFNNYTYQERLDMIHSMFPEDCNCNDSDI